VTENDTQISMFDNNIRYSAADKTKICMKSVRVRVRVRVRVSQSQSQSQSQSHFATDGRSVSMSWCRAPSVAHDQIFVNSLKVTVLSY
jgi:hypothetical protein